MQSFLKDTGANYLGFLQDFKIVSKDPTNGESLIEDDLLKIINFDKVSEYHKDTKKYGEKYRSNDAYFVSPNERIFIEFKNGKIFHNGYLESDVLKELREKNCSSLLVASDINWISNLHDSQDNLQYMLVYSSEKCSEADIGKSKYSIRKRTSHLATASSCPAALSTMKWLFSSLSICSDKEFVDNFIKQRYTAA